MTGKLTAGQIKVLKYATRSRIKGPSPGWNADVELSIGGLSVGGEELQPLFDAGLLEALAIPPPHDEEFDPEMGSLTITHEWRTSPAGLTALQETKT